MYIHTEGKNTILSQILFFQKQHQPLLNENKCDDHQEK